MSIFQINSKEFPFLSSGVVGFNKKTKVSAEYVLAPVFLYVAGSSTVGKYDNELNEVDSVYRPTDDGSTSARRFADFGDFIIFNDGMNLVKASKSDLSSFESCAISDTYSTKSVACDGSDYAFLGGEPSGDSGYKTLFKIDLSTMTVVESERHVTSTDYYSINDMIYHGGYLYVAESGEDSVMKIDPSDLSKVDSCELGDSPQCIYFDHDDRMYVGDSGGNIHEIDPTDMSIIKTTELSSGDNVVAITEIDGLIYASNWSYELFQLASNLNVVQSLTTDKELYGLAGKGDILYGAGDGSLYQIDLESFSVSSEKSVSISWPNDLFMDSK